MRSQWKPAIVVLALLTALTGAVYPLLVTVAARALFPRQAAGSLVRFRGVVVGSELIGQEFDDPRFFWGRLSATPSFPYNAGSSGGSNYGPLNDSLAAAARARLAALRRADPTNTLPVPSDLLTASASGLDPHISPEAARYQAARVARLRGLSEAGVRRWIDEATEARLWGLFGERRVNVLKLNIRLESSR